MPTQKEKVSPIGGAFLIPLWVYVTLSDTVTLHGNVPMRSSLTRLIRSTVKPGGRVGAQAVEPFDEWQVYLSEMMIDKYIEFDPSPDGESFFACYRNFKIADFSTQNGELIRRIISRL